MDDDSKINQNSKTKYFVVQATKNDAGTDYKCDVNGKIQDCEVFDLSEQNTAGQSTNALKDHTLKTPLTKANSWVENQYYVVKLNDAVKTTSKISSIKNSSNADLKLNSQQNAAIYFANKELLILSKLS